MNEILFRCKEFGSERINDGVWRYGYYVEYPYKERAGMIISPNYAWDVGGKVLYEHIVCPDFLGQYTGLKDSKDVRIFEGDVIKYINTSGNTLTAAVYYNDRQAGFIVRHLFSKIIEVSLYCAAVHCNRGRGCEVIGNIHDNSELLEKGEENE